MKLSIRMPDSLRWRLRSYAADRRMPLDELVRQLLERELAGWYTARRGEPPAAGRPDAPADPPAPGPVRLAAAGEEAA